MILVPFDDPKKHCSIIQYREAKFKQHKHSKIWTRYFKTITFKCLAVPRIGISENYIFADWDVADFYSTLSNFVL